MRERRKLTPLLILCGGIAAMLMVSTLRETAQSGAAPTSSDAKLHLAAAPEDFKALGVGKEIEVREDGRRTPRS